MSTTRQWDLVNEISEFAIRYESGLEKAPNLIKNERRYETIISILQYRDDTSYFWGRQMHDGLVIFISHVKTMIKKNSDNLEKISVKPILDALMGKKESNEMKNDKDERWNTQYKIIVSKFKAYSESNFVGKQKDGYKRYGYYVMVILWIIFFEFNIIKIDDIMQKVGFFDEDVFFPFIDHIGSRMKNEETEIVISRMSESLYGTFRLPTTQYDNNLVESILNTLKLHWLFAHDIGNYENNIMKSKIESLVSKTISNDIELIDKITKLMSLVYTRRGDTNIDIGDCISSVIKHVGGNVSTNIFSVLLGFVSVGHYWHKNDNNVDCGKMMIKIPMITDVFKYNNDKEFRDNVDRTWAFTPIWLRSHDLREFLRLMDEYRIMYQRKPYLSPDLTLWLHSGLHTIK